MIFMNAKANSKINTKLNAEYQLIDNIFVLWLIYALNVMIHSNRFH